MAGGCVRDIYGAILTPIDRSNIPHLLQVEGWKRMPPAEAAPFRRAEVDHAALLSELGYDAL